jgi:hypothetical protein
MLCLIAAALAVCSSYIAFRAGQLVQARKMTKHLRDGRE